MAHEMQTTVKSTSFISSAIPGNNFNTPQKPKPNFLQSNYSTIKANENNNDNNRGSKLLIEFPLLEQPQIQCSNLEELGSASFVNVVLENGNLASPSTSTTSPSSSFFRVSGESNNEIFRVKNKRKSSRRSLDNKGIKYLECSDKSGKCVMLIAYPVGLGEVALLSPNEELLGECQPNVNFICLSVKVKYNFYDANGNRLMKMTALLRGEGNERKFILIVKRSQTEKLALIKMGSLKTCCHIKFKEGQATVLERLQIIALWIGFMHNELHDELQPSLVERQAALKLQRKESQKKIVKACKIESCDSNDTDARQVPIQNDIASPSPSSPSSFSLQDFHLDATVVAEHPPIDKRERRNSQCIQTSQINGAGNDDVTPTLLKLKNLVKSKLTKQKTDGKYSFNNNNNRSGGNIKETFMEQNQSTPVVEADRIAK